MYNEELTRLPRDAEDLWAALRDQFDLAVMLFRDTTMEQKHHALHPEKREKSKGLRSIGAVIPYRGTSVEWDNRDHFFEMGQSLVPEIERAIKVRALTPQFVQQWGMFMFCHGFIASYVLDDSDPMANKRGGIARGRQRSKDPQRKWLAHVLLGLMRNGMTRGEAEEKTVALVTERVQRPELRGSFEEQWFRSMITHGDLSATYDHKHFSGKKMEELLRLPINDIPPLPDIP